jgi:hypothetical protein
LETNVRTPLEIFTLPQHLVVPLFQRPYVWDEDDQWAPLWHDVRRMAELRLQDPYTSAAHFLGALVVQAQESVLGNVQARNVIDGQQRLTTLQLLMDAAGSVFEELGIDSLAAQLQGLTHNTEMYVRDLDERLKLRHTNKDRDAFLEVMNAEPPVNHRELKHTSTRVVRAHQFFVAVVANWLREEGDAELTRRAGALADVLNRGLQLVIIDLRTNEDSQEIFETLNARGTPLTAADLIKNFVFQKLEQEGVDTEKAYAEEWPFERKFWETEIGVGRYNISRSSLFFNQWLGSLLGEEISPKSTFTRFKSYVEHESGEKMSQLLAIIRQQADRYEAWTMVADDPDRDLKRVELAFYRMKAGGVEVLKPILLWLHQPGRDFPQDTIDKVVGSMESWVMRRQLLRTASADMGRVVADVIRVHRTIAAEELPARIEEYLTNLKVASTYWPGDRELRDALLSERAYQRYPRARLRMFLEAVEDQLRAVHRVGRVSRRGYPIEHLLPQKWQKNWRVEDVQAELDRAEHVHRLGNLTLLTESLNSSVSNGPWLGENGKWTKLEKYDVLLMNREIRRISKDGWDEQRIDERTLAMVDTLIEVWPVPAGHEGKILDSRADERTWVELKHILAAGLLKPGTRLKPRPGSWHATEAVVTRDGALDIDGKKFQSPSGAGRYVKGAVTNGWSFWRLDDGRRLSDVRAAYRGEKTEHNDEPSLLSEWCADDFDAAVTVWSGITLKARELFRVLIAGAPERVSADDLAQELQLDSGASVAGLLSWPTRLAVRAGRPAPIRTYDGTSTAYWMDDDTAALFAAVASAQS